MQDAVDRGVLPGFRDQYLKMLSVRPGKSAKAYVVRVEDFVKLYSSA